MHGEREKSKVASPTIRCACSNRLPTIRHACSIRSPQEALTCSKHGNSWLPWKLQTCGLHVNCCVMNYVAVHWPISSFIGPSQAQLRASPHGEGTLRHPVHCRNLRPRRCSGNLQDGVEGWRHTVTRRSPPWLPAEATPQRPSVAAASHRPASRACRQRTAEATLLRPAPWAAGSWPQTPS